MRSKEQIAKENDRLRSELMNSSKFRVMITRGVQFHPLVGDILTAVRQFNVFTEDNDPHGEHDFGQVTIANEKFFWKFDYYDTNLEYGVDPYGDDEMIRVLTIMKAEEY